MFCANNCKVPFFPPTKHCCLLAREPFCECRAVRSIRETCDFVHCAGWVVSRAIMGALIAVICNELLRCSHCVVLSFSNRKEGKNVSSASAAASVPFRHVVSECGHNYMPKRKWRFGGKGDAVIRGRWLWYQPQPRRPQFHQHKHMLLTYRLQIEQEFEPHQSCTGFNPSQTSKFLLIYTHMRSK